MGHRLTRIYTRTGDDGSTGLGDGRRVPKDSARVQAMGAVDEANSTLGMVLAESIPEAVADCLTSVQHQLFDLGGELSLPGAALIHAEDVAGLEHDLDGFNAGLPALKNFILPGGGRAAAATHQVRAIVRRAERDTLALSREEAVRPELLHYLNRLSDLLFVVARVLARADGRGEVLWQRATRANPPRAVPGEPST